MGIRLVTPPALTPVSLAEAKAHLRVTHSDHDLLISQYIAAATAYLDGWHGILGRALVTQTWELLLDAFPTDDAIMLPLMPVQSVATVKYDDAEGIEQTWPAADNYAVDITSAEAWVVLIGGVAWPVTLAAINAARVAFVAGYGAPAAVPEALRTAILLHVERLYHAMPEGDRLANERAYISLITPYRRHHV